MTKRYALFMYDDYDALGGIKDLVDTYDSFEKAKNDIVIYENTMLNKLNHKTKPFRLGVDNYQIADLETLEILEVGDWWNIKQ